MWYVFILKMTKKVEVDRQKIERERNGDIHWMLHADEWSERLLSSRCLMPSMYTSRLKSPAARGILKREKRLSHLSLGFFAAQLTNQFQDAKYSWKVPKLACDLTMWCSELNRTRCTWSVMEESSVVLPGSKHSIVWSQAVAACTCKEFCQCTLELAALTTCRRAEYRHRTCMLEEIGFWLPWILWKQHRRQEPKWAYNNFKLVK